MGDGGIYKGVINVYQGVFLLQKWKLWFMGDNGCQSS